MKNSLFFLLLFCFSNSTDLFAQCSGGGSRSGGWGFRSSRGQGGVIGIFAVEKFKNWQESVPSNSSLLINLGYQQTQWQLNNEGISKSKIISEFSIDFGWGFYLGKNRRWEANITPSFIFPINPYLPVTDNLFTIKARDMFAISIGLKNYLWVLKRSRVYISADGTYRSIRLNVERNVATNNSQKWYVDFLSKSQKYNTLIYNDMLNAMQHTERDYIPIDNGNLTFNFGLGWDHVIKNSNVLIKTEIGLRYNTGLIFQNWNYEYCEVCKDSGKRVHLKADVANVPYNIDKNILFYLKFGFAFFSLK